jgi:hypothetical protein
MSTKDKFAAAGLLFFIILGATLFAIGIAKDKEKNEQKARMQFVRDSLQIELMKKQLKDGIKE